MTARLEACGLAVRYGDATVLQGVDLALDAGTVTALLGPNGAGKTTLLRALAGVLTPAAGQIVLDGADLAGMDRRDAARRIAILSGDIDVAFAWTSLEIVLMGRAPHLGGGQLEGDADRARAVAALELLDAAHLRDRPITELSAGERQRVLIARALAQDTPVLLLDEPTSHLDPSHALRVGDVLRGLAAEGRTVVCVLHDLNLAARTADRLVFLQQGRLAADGPPDAVLTPATLKAVYGVDARRIAGEPPAVILGGS